MNIWNIKMRQSMKVLYYKIQGFKKEINSNSDRIYQVISDYSDDIYVQSKAFLRYNEVQREILHLEKAKILCTLFENVRFIESIEKNIVSIIIECSIKSVNKKYRYTYQKQYIEE